ncbi:MAG: hypothetical protein LQ349_000319 [Xanthoria aureola]|nr:MAG: hypothetical protein LQ349_000319 [Xanthoria aureola]
MFSLYRSNVAPSSPSDYDTPSSISDWSSNGHSPYAAAPAMGTRQGDPSAGYYRGTDADDSAISLESPSSGDHSDGSPYRRRSMFSTSSSSSSDEDTADVSASHRDCSHEPPPPSSCSTTKPGSEGSSSFSTKSGSVSSDDGNDNSSIPTCDNHATDAGEGEGEGQPGYAPSPPSDSSGSDTSTSDSNDSEDDNGAGPAALDLLGVHHRYICYETLRSLEKSEKEGLKQLQGTMTDLQSTADLAFKALRKNFEEQDAAAEKLRAKERKMRQSRAHQLTALGPLKRKLLHLTAYVESEEKRLRSI